MTTELVGTTLGQYRIIELTDRDEVTIAYKAWQHTLERYVMFKVLAPRLSNDPELVRRFLWGAAAAAQLRHPHLVKVLNFGTQSGYSYVVTQFVEGASVEELVRSGTTFTLRQVTDIASHVASALDYAHVRGIIHRGVKSANILIDGTGRAVLTGFGIAEALIASGTITKTGALIDAACYASPEMIRDQPLDHRSDLYALGIVCYEMLAGRVPFQGDSPHTTFLAQLHAPPPPLPVPSDVEAVLHKVLAKRPEQRYDSAGEFARELTRAVSSTAGAPTPALAGTPEQPGENTPIPAPAEAPGWPGHEGLLHGDARVTPPVVAATTAETPPPAEKTPEPPRRRELSALMAALRKWDDRRGRAD